MDGQIHMRTRQNGGTTTYSYTPLGQVQSVVSPGAAPVSYTYEPNSGRMATRVDAGGLHTFTYAPTTGLPTGESIGTSPGSIGLLAGASISYDYDSQLRRKSLSASYAAQAVPVTAYLYSPLGRLSRVTNQGAQVDYAYEPNSTLVEHRDYKYGNDATPIMTAGHAYDARGNLVDVINARPVMPVNEKISHHYTVDKLNRRTVAEREDYSRWEYGYDTRSQVISGWKSNNDGILPGTQRAYSYDNIGNRVTSKEGGGATVGSNLRTMTYTPNDLNQYTQIERTSRKVDFVGTAGWSDVMTLNRPGLSPLPAETQPPWWRLEVDPPTATSLFAAADIRKNGVNIDGGTTPRLAPAYRDPQTLVYDANGNLTHDGRMGHVWDTEGRLQASSPPGYGNFSSFYLWYIYDAEGRRIGKHVYGTDVNASSSIALYTDVYLYDGWNVIATYRMDHVAAAASGIPVTPKLRQTYTWGLDVSGTYQGAGGVGGLLMITEIERTWVTPPGASNSYEVEVPHHRFPAYDGNGNVMALVSAQTITKTTGITPAGSIDASYEYDPFGRVLRATGSYAQANPFRFSTKFTDDETGLVYYGYRYYDTVLGRWLSRDPIAEDGGLNVYGMCGNDAVTTSDIDGRRPTSIEVSAHGSFVNVNITQKVFWECPDPEAVELGATLAQQQKLTKAIEKAWKGSFKRNANKENHFEGQYFTVMADTPVLYSIRTKIEASYFLKGEEKPRDRTTLSIRQVSRATAMRNCKQDVACAVLHGDDIYISDNAVDEKAVYAHEFGHPLGLLDYYVSWGVFPNRHSRPWRGWSGNLMSERNPFTKLDYRNIEELIVVNGKSANLGLEGGGYMQEYSYRKNASKYFPRDSIPPGNLNY